jgi:hypothetical protein
VDLSRLSDSQLMTLRNAGGDVSKLSDDDLGSIRASLADKPTSAPRLVGQFAQNANDAIVNTAAAPADLSGGVMKWLGLVDKDTPPLSTAYKQAVDDVAGVPLRIRDAWNQGSLDPLFAPRDAYQTRFAPENRAEKIAAGVGQGVGTVAATLMPASAIANTARAGGVTQGVAQTMASQPITQIASGVAGGATTGATDNPLLGAGVALATPLAAAMARGAISPTVNRLTDAEKRLAELAQSKGISLTPAQQTGSPTLRSLEETMAKLPLSSGPMSGAYRDQRTALQRGIMEKTGTVADDASPETMKKAFERAGQTFDDLLARTPAVNGDKQLADEIAGVAEKYGRRLESNVAPVFKSFTDDLAPLLDSIRQGSNNPQMTGEVYKNIRSDLAKSIRNTKDSQLKEALGGLARSLDDAVERSVGGGLRSEWQEARRQYQALKTVDKAMQGGTQAERASGNIPLGAFSGAVRDSDRAGFSRGRGQYGDDAKLADFLAARVPDSGTVGRGLAANLVTGGALFGGGAATGIGLPAAAAAAATPWAVSKLYNTPLAKAYLTNQAAGNTNFRALYGSEAMRRMIEESREEPSALARALMHANERRSAR